jgi:hypothetical protein
MAKLKDLTAKSLPPRTEEYYALASGGQPWRDYLPLWMPRHPAEGTDRHHYRLSLASYSPDLPPLLNQMVSSLLASPLVLTDASEEWQTFASDVDGEDTTLTSLGYAVMHDALIAGESMMFITSGMDSHPKVEHIPRQKINRIHRKGKDVSWMIVDDGNMDISDGMTPVVVRQYRYIDPLGVDVYHVPQDRQLPPDADIPVHSSTPHMGTWDYAPVVVMTIPEGSHALRILADTAVALIRARASLTWALTQAAYPLLIIRSDIPMDSPRVGAGWYLQVGTSDDVKFIEPPGSSLAALREDVISRRDDMYRAVSALFLSGHSDSLQAQSGVSKSMDWRALEVSLGVYHSCLMRAMTSMLGYVAAMMSSPAPGITGGDGWHVEDIHTLMSVYPFLRDLSPDPEGLKSQIYPVAASAAGITPKE